MQNGKLRWTTTCLRECVVCLLKCCNTRGLLIKAEMYFQVSSVLLTLNHVSRNSKKNSYWCLPLEAIPRQSIALANGQRTAVYLVNFHRTERHVASLLTYFGFANCTHLLGDWRKRVIVYFVMVACKCVRNIYVTYLWIIGIRMLLRKVVHECVVCTRYWQEVGNQFMADLPAVLLQTVPALHGSILRRTHHTQATS